jgi:hypothetical protein
VAPVSSDHITAEHPCPRSDPRERLRPSSAVTDLSLDATKARLISLAPVIALLCAHVYDVKQRHVTTSRGMPTR